MSLLLAIPILATVAAIVSGLGAIVLIVAFSEDPDDPAHAWFIADRDEP